VALVVFAPICFSESDSVETLLAYLKSPNVRTRLSAARKLGQRRVRNQPVVEALGATARSDEDWNVRAAAVESLGMIKDFSALPAIFDALKDREVEVRRVAARSLVAFYTEHDIDFITNRRSGINLFNPFLDTSDHEIIEPYIKVDATIISALGETVRNDPERDVRVAAVRALGVLRGNGAIRHLADSANADQDIRVEVLRAFVKIGDQSAGEHLVRFFSDSNEKVRTQAMLAAGLLKYRPAVDPLLAIYALGPESTGTIKKVTRPVKGIFSYDPPRDEAALWALSLIGDDRAERVFVDNMTNDDSDRRQYAFEGLARLANPTYLNQTSRLILGERSTEVQMAQQWALYRMGSRANLQYIVRKLDTDHAEQARGYLMETENLSDLYPQLQSSNVTVRRKVIEILGRIGDDGTIRELEPIARSSGAETADTAIVAIKRIEWRQAGGPRATDSLLPGEERKRRSNDN
jgi:HEAT repeat protein